jgi:hypothetical protein
LLRLCVWGDSRLGRLPMGRLLMHLPALACIALSCFSIFPGPSRQCYLFVSLESTKRLWCSVHLTWWHSGRSDIRGFPGRILLGIAASRYSNIYQCSQSHTTHSFSFIYYCITSLDSEHGSSFGHYTRTWMYTETKYCRLEISGLMVLSFCIHSCSYIMTWWWPLFKVKTS